MGFYTWTILWPLLASFGLPEMLTAVHTYIFSRAMLQAPLVQKASHLFSSFLILPRLGLKEAAGGVEPEVLASEFWPCGEV